MARKSPVGERETDVAIVSEEKQSTMHPVGRSQVRILESSDVDMIHLASEEKVCCTSKVKGKGENTYQVENTIAMSIKLSDNGKRIGIHNTYAKIVRHNGQKPIIQMDDDF